MEYVARGEKMPLRVSAVDFDESNGKLAKLTVHLASSELKSGRIYDLYRGQRPRKRSHRRYLNIHEFNVKLPNNSIFDSPINS